VGEIFAKQDEVSGGEGGEGITHEAAALAFEDEGELDFRVMVPEELEAGGDEAARQEGVGGGGGDLFEDGSHGVPAVRSSEVQRLEV